MTGRDRQTVADVALECCGNADSMFPIMRHNNISADAEVAGMELLDEEVMEQRTVDYMRTQKANPACVCADLAANALTNDDESDTIVTENNESITE